MVIAINLLALAMKQYNETASDCVLLVPVHGDINLSGDLPSVQAEPGAVEKEEVTPHLAEPWDKEAEVVHTNMRLSMSTRHYPFFIFNKLQLVMYSTNAPHSPLVNGFIAHNGKCWRFQSSRTWSKVKIVILQYCIRFIDIYGPPIAEPHLLHKYLMLNHHKKIAVLSK